MVDSLTPGARSENMRRIRSRDTKPEKLIRSSIHRAGYRFRLHRRDLPGKPDIVFPSCRVAVFVHGCFWHQHSACREGRLPKSNQGYWKPKLEANVQRHATAIAALRRAEWLVMTLWECEIEQDLLKVRDRVIEFLESGGSSPGGES